jgi:hypothetical protein
MLIKNQKLKISIRMHFSVDFTLSTSGDCFYIIINKIKTQNSKLNNNNNKNNNNNNKKKKKKKKQLHRSFLV